MHDLIVLTNGYPSENDLYNNAFVHQRVKGYLSEALNTVVIITGREGAEETDYIFDGVTVKKLSPTSIGSVLSANTNAKICVHFIDSSMIDIFSKYHIKNEIYVWIHGSEALSWKRRLFNYNLSPVSVLKLIKYTFTNTKRLKELNKALHYFSNMKFVFVSKWMKDVFESDVNYKLESDRYTIIPNYINGELYSFKDKNASQRYKILSIRPYHSLKYANDISVKVIQELSKKEYFDNFQIEFYGRGKLFDKTLKPLRKYENVKLNNKFLSQLEISELHKSFGIFLCPTRQDAQGVSMCEAMSSGLVVLTNNNTAIPEFAPTSCAYLNDKVSDFVNAIEEMIYNEKVFNSKSRNASVHINKKCGIHVIDDEIKFMGIVKEDLIKNTKEMELDYEN